MFYCVIYLRGFPELLTWSSEKNMPLGSRVEVLLRGKKKIGIVVEVHTEKPSFRVMKVQKLLNESFISREYFETALEVSQENFCFLGKVLDIMIPEKYFDEIAPEKYQEFYILNSTAIKGEKITGVKQQECINIISENNGKIKKEVLKKNISTQTINSLLKKNILTEERGDLKLIENNLIKKESKIYDLKPWQKDCLKKIQETEKPVLLWGVTGSGKTEIYKHLVLDLEKRMLERKEKFQVLLLVPEIALTPQLINEFKVIFGKKVAVWHSKLNAQEKVQEYERIRLGKAQILIGARSAVFVPMPYLKQIILDEEHEWTFKNEFNPRFRTHDVVEKFRKKMNVKLLFGTATPRVESLIHVKQGNWLKVELFKKVFEQKQPNIEIIDIKNESKKGNFSPISEKLFAAIKNTIQNKRQIVLFLNKRGFSGSTFCLYCSQDFACRDCSAQMKVHGFGRKNTQAKLICHLCGYMENFPEKCPSCKKKNFQFKGWGTEQVELFLAKYLPTARVLRVDRDKVSGKHDLQNILRKFYHHEADILLGTQMVAKGLDFEKVDLVGVIMADVGLSLPDFRSEERVFQLLNQVSGRAGRRETQGRVLVQTYRKEEALFKYLKNNLTKEFYAEQIKNREDDFMPPFSHMVKITVGKEKKSDSFSQVFRIFKDLEKMNKEENLGFEIHWAPSFIPRMYNKFWFHILVKTPNEKTSFNFIKRFEFQEGTVIDMSPNSLL